MKTQEYANQIAKSIAPSRVPGHIILFDGEDLVGILPVRNWSSAFTDALRLFPYDAAAVVIHHSPPPFELIETAAANCTIRYNGVAHARPIRLLRLESSSAALTA